MEQGFRAASGLYHSLTWTSDPWPIQWSNPPGDPTANLGGRPYSEQFDAPLFDSIRSKGHPAREQLPLRRTQCPLSLFNCRQYRWPISIHALLQRAAEVSCPATGLVSPRGQ